MKEKRNNTNNTNLIRSSEQVSGAWQREDILKLTEALAKPPTSTAGTWTSLPGGPPGPFLPLYNPVSMQQPEQVLNMQIRSHHLRLKTIFEE